MPTQTLVEKRSSLMAARKAITDKVSSENRAPTPEEKEKILALRAECDDVELMLGEQGSQLKHSESVKAMEKAARDAVGRGDTVGSVESDFSEKDISRYSLTRCMRMAADKLPITGLEKEMSDHLAKKTGQTPRNGGLLIPTRVLMQPRMAIVTTTTGAGAVSTVTSADYIDALRNLSIIGPAGFTVINDLQGKFAIPQVTTDHTAYWPGEGTGSTISTTAMGAVTFAGKQVRAHQDFTPTFMNQASFAVENYARSSLLGVIAAAVGTAVVNGTGGSNTILGLMNNTSTGLVTLLTAAKASSGAIVTNLTGGAPTWASVVAMESQVGSQNVDITNGSYIGSWPCRGAHKATAKSTNAALFICEDNMMNGYPFLATSGMPDTCGTNSASSNLIFVNGSDVVVASWGQPEITFDPYSLSTSGALRVCIGQEVDAQLRHNGSVCREYGIAV